MSVENGRRSFLKKIGLGIGAVIGGAVISKEAPATPIEVPEVPEVTVTPAGMDTSDLFGSGPLGWDEGSKNLVWTDASGNGSIHTTGIGGPTWLPSLSGTANWPPRMTAVSG